MTPFVQQIIASIIGALLGGGLIIAFIEIRRHRHEQKNWMDQDKKVELQVISAEVCETKWHPNNYDSEKEKLRIYEKKLDGTVKRWEYVIKVSLTNLTDRDLLALTLDLVIPEPKIGVPPGLEKKGMPRVECGQMRYNLLKKDNILPFDLPMVLPAKSKSGVVFVGYYCFDYPQLVDEMPGIVKFSTRLDEGASAVLGIHLSPVDSLKDADLTYVNGGAGELHWIPYMDKHEIDHTIPF